MIVLYINISSQNTNCDLCYDANCGIICKTSQNLLIMANLILLKLLIIIVIDIFVKMWIWFFDNVTII